MEIKMTENTWLMGKLYKMGFVYDVTEEIQDYLKDKSITIKEKKSTTKAKKSR